MMTKQIYKKFAEALSQISDVTKRENLVDFLAPVFREDNARFDEDRFNEYIHRLVEGKSLVGLR